MSKKTKDVVIDENKAKKVNENIALLEKGIILGLSPMIESGKVTRTEVNTALANVLTSHLKEDLKLICQK